MRKTEGFSWLIKPTLYIIDLLIIFFLSKAFLTENTIDICFFFLLWLILSVSFSFYKVFRHTKLIKIIQRVFKQIITFYLSILSYLYLLNKPLQEASLLKFFLMFFVIMVFWRALLFFLFKKYRVITGGNIKRVIIIGNKASTKALQSFFEDAPSYGYKFLGRFTDDNDEEKTGDIQSSFEYVINNKIDEVYCSLRDLSNKTIRSYVDFCDINMKSLRFIPDNKGLFAKNLHLDFYDITPVLSLTKTPLRNNINKIIKRGFDVIFSLFVIIVLLSWFIPLLGLIIIIESKGPVFFKQNRPGINEEGFTCYKFRSMSLNSRTEESATKNDARVTKVGKFIRKTSIDELPQFFNVLLGTMSVVGPRPHLWSQNKIYRTKISKYMSRHFVKPGITGLAQVRGYRGEITKKEDIINRIKYDVFYIENWSLLLDINIIYRTVYNIFKGEEKAY